MQHKSKKNLSEWSSLFNNNDYSDAIFSVSCVLNSLRFSKKDLSK